MKSTLRKVSLILTLLASSMLTSQAAKPWDNGRLRVSDNNRYLVFENGEPFFWLGNTSWLMPERLNRDDVEFYLTKEKENGYNVEQVQVLCSTPTYNIYGRAGNRHDFDFTKESTDDVYGYWEHLDYIVEFAESQGIYIAMDVIWGSQLGRMDEQKAANLGKFIGERYAKYPNIIWMIGGDIMGNKKPEVWDAMARAIKKADSIHMMTFHPRGRTTSAWWFNDREWMDFNMFQSGHRRYGQRNGDGDYTIKDDTEEDNWRYVEMSLEKKPIKPIIDGEPSYEDIPQGLHDGTQPRWQDYDVRRYAYWAVFAGCFGHTYGHNSIMQFMRPGILPSFFAEKPWWDALNDPGYKQMKYLKALMLSVPFTEGDNDQSIITSKNGEKYDRIIATRGNDYMFIYNYTGHDMTIDMTKISGKKKDIWLMNPRNGEMKYLGEIDKNKHTLTFSEQGSTGQDMVVIITDSSKKYFAKDQKNIIR
ncbi:MAG: glycoside hydrolase family 140 protein [Prevotellaceae bacterium]|nr:glycoside hydrolase family 140 protein [Prevotellaceae bacterium]